MDGDSALRISSSVLRFAAVGLLAAGTAVATQASDLVPVPLSAQGVPCGDLIVPQSELGRSIRVVHSDSPFDLTPQVQQEIQSEFDRISELCRGAGIPCPRRVRIYYRYGRSREVRGSAIVAQPSDLRRGLSRDALLSHEAGHVILNLLLQERSSDSISKHFRDFVRRGSLEWIADRWNAESLVARGRPEWRARSVLARNEFERLTALGAADPASQLLTALEAHYGELFADFLSNISGRDPSRTFRSLGGQDDPSYFRQFAESSQYWGEQLNTELRNFGRDESLSEVVAYWKNQASNKLDYPPESASGATTTDSRRIVLAQRDVADPHASLTETGQWIWTTYLPPSKRTDENFARVLRVLGQSILEEIESWAKKGRPPHQITAGELNAGLRAKFAEVWAR